MKTILLFINILLLSTQVSAQDFFPIKENNKYQFREYLSGYGHGGGGSYSIIRYYRIHALADTVIGMDTLNHLSYSSQYFDPFPTFYFFNYDRSDQKLFLKFINNDTLRLAADFLAPAGTSFLSYFRGVPAQYFSRGRTVDVVFGDSLLSYSMLYGYQSGSSRDTIIYHFADGVGLYKFRFFRSVLFQFQIHQHSLISAIIDSVVYNPIHLSVDTLYPLIDRPLHAFPFVLYSDYTTQYPGLIDTFYLSVEQVRNGSVINTFNFGFQNKQINFNLSPLMVGDVLKLRATIRDKSIFNNESHFPDTGWAVINVISQTTLVESENNKTEFSLAQNYPNPFNPSTVISWQSPVHSHQTLRVYDMLGREVETLVDEERPAGRYEATFDATGLASGVYLYRLIAGEYVKTNKMILLR